jgi:hypothetical protein
MSTVVTGPNLQPQPPAILPNGDPITDNPDEANIYNLSRSGAYAPLVLNLGNDGNTPDSKNMGDIINVTAPTLTGSAILGSNDILNLPEGWITSGTPAADGTTVYTNADGSANFAVTGGHVNIAGNTNSAPGLPADNPTTNPTTPAIDVQPAQPTGITNSQNGH